MGFQRKSPGRKNAQRFVLTQGNRASDSHEHSRSRLLIAAACIGAAFSVDVAAATPALPPLTPMFCAETICVFARGPYAVQRRMSFSDGAKEGVALTFQDGTVMSFGVASTRSPCSEFNKKWLDKSKLTSVTFLCAGGKNSTNTVVAVRIKSPLAPTLGRFQGESEICVWRLRLAKVINNRIESLPISHQTCVGDRLGYALPAGHG